MNIQPLHDRIIIKPIVEPRLSAGSIIIPDSATEKPIKGEVIAVGRGKYLEDGTLRQSNVKIGDKVLFGKFDFPEINISGICYIVMQEDALMGVFDD